MNKNEIINIIIEAINREALNLASAARIASQDATDSESKAENKYDTRGLEASYLAGAQAKLAAESLQNAASFKSLELQKFTKESKIVITALVKLESEEGKYYYYFIGPKSGGTEIEYNGIKIIVITPSSPIGLKLIGRESGDVITLNNGGTKKEYEIISVE